MKNPILILIVFVVLFSGTSYANNLRITNTTRPAADKIKFDIAWDNSWYTNAAPNNWDAIWVFIKAQDCNTDEKAWVHVDVSTSDIDHSTSSPLQVDAVTDGKGVFIRRETFGVGNIPTTSVELKLQNSYNLSNVNFEVLGIEMVSVLEGGFETGIVSRYTTSYPTYSSHYFYCFSKQTISSESVINAGTLRTPSLSSSETSDYGYHPTIPAAFPKGYNKFYIMKYEISQEQYVRFLNLLNYSQQNSRTYHDPASPVNTNALAVDGATSTYYRNGIKIKVSATSSNPAVYDCDLNTNGSFDENDDGQNIACNFLNWEDLLAYLDWSALRPMTELEYEKACRGFDPAVTDEYAWGNTNITPTNSNLLSNAGEGSEISTTTLVSNYGLAAVQGSGSASYGPLRVGFAARNSPSRIFAGASYWGVLDLTGNVWEQAVSVGYRNSNISAFTGVLGDGALDGSGDANQTGWDLDPLYSIVRGGSWLTSTTASGNYSMVGSRRWIYTTTYNDTRNRETGGRGVRQF